MSIIKKMKEISEKKNISTSVLALYLLNYEGDILDLKIKPLCDAARVSYATPTRLAQQLGLNGFRELKYELIAYKDMRNKMVLNDGILDIDSYKYSLSASIDLCFKTISVLDINYIASQIIKKDRIKIYGVGQSHLIGLDLHSKLVRFDKISLCPSSESEMYTSSKLASYKDLIIGISYSGNTKQVIEALNRAKEKGATTILFTTRNKDEFNYDHVIELNLLENEISNLSMISNTLLLIIFDFIYIKILEINPEYKKYLELTSMKR